MRHPKQCFRVTPQILESMSVEEINATWDAMVACGVARPPYDEFDIQLPMKDHIRLVEDDGHIQTEEEIIAGGHGYILDGRPITYSYSYDPTKENQVSCASWMIDGSGKPAQIEVMLSEKTLPNNTTRDWLGQHKEASTAIYKAFIVLLATKNVIKDVKENKLAKLGIGKKRNPYRYVTTLRIGEVVEHASCGDPTGKTLRPHLRRGHVRHQHYGPKNAFVRSIFIEPVFVNADPDWIGARTAYNVGGHAVAHA